MNVWLQGLPDGVRFFALLYNQAQNGQPNYS